MSIVDVLITIIVVTILVTITLGVATYLAYKVRLARKPSGSVSSDPAHRYFRLHLPPPSADAEGDPERDPAAVTAADA